MTVGSYEAKTHLPALLERVAKGEEIVITRHGVPVAKLVPVAATAKPDSRAAVERIKQLSKGVRLDGVSIRDMINEGRR